MGLEGVELVLAIEERFAIGITDEEASAARTPKQLIELVLKKLGATSAASGNGPCASQRAFYLLRRLAAEHFRVPRRSFHPTTSLEEIIPTKNRKAEWRKFGDALGLYDCWPELQFSLPLVIAILAISLLASVATAACVYSIPMRGSAVGAVALGFISFVLWFRLLQRLAEPLRVEFAQPSNVAGLVDLVVWRKSDLLSLDSAAITRERVSVAVREIISHQLGLTGSPSEFNDDSDFVRDLGLY